MHRGDGREVMHRINQWAEGFLKFGSRARGRDRVWVRKGRESIFILCFLVIRVPVFRSLRFREAIVLKCEGIGTGVG